MALAVHEPPGGVYPRGRGVDKRCFQMLHSNGRHVKFKFRKYALLRRSVGILLVHPHFCYPYKKTDTSSPHIPVSCRSLNDNAQNILQLSLKIQECARDESQSSECKVKAQDRPITQVEESLRKARWGKKVELSIHTRFTTIYHGKLVKRNVMQGRKWRTTFMRPRTAKI